MDRQKLAEYGLKIGIDLVEKRNWIMGETVCFMHEKAETGILDIEAYKRMTYLIDRTTFWQIDDCHGFISKPLNDREAKDYLKLWLANDANLSKYAYKSYER